MISEAGEAPTFTSSKYMFFGTVEVTMRTAKGAGIITTIVLESDVLDEIDWEWLGGVDGTVQSNFFSKGDTSSYGKLESELAVPGGDDKGTFHTYTLDWTPEKLEWKIDGVSLRTLTYAGNENTYPQTPMMVKFGTWCAGCSDAPGTVAWAGGAPDWSQAPFIAYYQSIKITDNSNGVANAETYEYTDQTGSMASIKINTGSGSTTSNNSDGDDDTSSTTTARVVSAAQGTATTLSTATDVNSAVAAATATGGIGQAESAQITSGSNSTSSNSTGTAATATAKSTSSAETGVVTSGGQKGAVNAAFVAAAMFAFFSL